MQLIQGNRLEPIKMKTANLRKQTKASEETQSYTIDYNETSQANETGKQTKASQENVQPIQATRLT